MNCRFALTTTYPPRLATQLGISFLAQIEPFLIAINIILHLGAMGNVHTSTCRAYTAAEMEKIVSKVHPA
jgi:uncharacterized protein with GYD domain